MGILTYTFIYNCSSDTYPPLLSYYSLNNTKNNVRKKSNVQKTTKNSRNKWQVFWMNSIAHLQSSINPYLPCSTAIKLHNITKNSNILYRPLTIHTIQTQHCSWTPVSAVQARQTISAMLSRKYIVCCSHPQHNPLPMHAHQLHSQHYLLHSLPLMCAW